MIRMDKESAELKLKGKSPQEIYAIVVDLIAELPDAKIQDLGDTLDWVAAQGYATAAELEAAEDAHS
jgi:coproporphyrinogen III oxidase-like Fe-S oxidoreductase